MARAGVVVLGSLTLLLANPIYYSTVRYPIVAGRLLAQYIVVAGSWFELSNGVATKRIADLPAFGCLVRHTRDRSVFPRSRVGIPNCQERLRSRDAEGSSLGLCILVMARTRSLLNLPEAYMCWGVGYVPIRHMVLLLVVILY